MSHPRTLLCLVFVFPNKLNNFPIYLSMYLIFGKGIPVTTRPGLPSYSLKQAMSSTYFDDGQCIDQTFWTICIFYFVQNKEVIRFISKTWISSACEIESILMPPNFLLARSSHSVFLLTLNRTGRCILLVTLLHT